MFKEIPDEVLAEVSGADKPPGLCLCCCGCYSCSCGWFDDESVASQVTRAAVNASSTTANQYAKGKDPLIP